MLPYMPDHLALKLSAYIFKTKVKRIVPVHIFHTESIQAKKGIQGW